mmetsp:Transcript_57005/g.135601  ORF Transcript_57005/g.135601 Transcript_57005/m.135601 type:complete len:375 (+) Transcript_57005:65-1189(+)
MEKKPQLTKAQWLRRERLGLNSTRSYDFLCGVEFIGLGSWCGVRVALDNLGLAQRAYPFDWLRSSVAGVLQCLSTEFKDFLTYSGIKHEKDLTGFTGSQWGGSFWHHDLRSEKVCQAYGRRIARFLGDEEVLPDMPRLFVRAVNTPAEVEAALQMHVLLQRLFPHTQVYLLLVIDVQQVAGLARLVHESCSNVLVYRIHERTHLQITEETLLGDALRMYSEDLEVAIATAVRYWAGEPDCHVTMYHSLADIAAACDQWFGGDTATELYKPVKTQSLMNFPSPPLVEETQEDVVMEIVLPELIPGSCVEVDAFGTLMTLQFTMGCKAGEIVVLHSKNGLVTAELSGACIPPMGEALVPEPKLDPAAHFAPLATYG